MVLSFPTAVERDNAKAILQPTEQVFERGDKKVSLWIKFTQNIEHLEEEELKDIFKSLNPEELSDENFEIGFLGKEPTRKRLRLRVSARKANKILSNGYLYAELTRHPVVLLNPLPFRCGNCLSFHHTRKEDCTKVPACRYCGKTHENDCPIYKKQPGTTLLPNLLDV